VALQMLRVCSELVGTKLAGDSHRAAETGAHHRRPGQQAEQHRLQPRARTDQPAWATGLLGGTGVGGNGVVETRVASMVDEL